MASIVAPMPGIVKTVNVKVGNKVENGQEVIILESMKMEVPIYSDVNGVVTDVKAIPSVPVNTGAVLLVISD